MSHERTRINFRTPTHFKESCVISLVIFDEDHIFTDMKINNITNARMNSVSLTLTIKESDSGAGANHCQSIPIDHFFSIEILSYICAFKLIVILKSTHFINNCEFFINNLPHQNWEHGNRYSEDTNWVFIYCHIKSVLWTSEWDWKGLFHGHKEEIGNSRRRSRMGDEDLGIERRLISWGHRMNYGLLIEVAFINVEEIEDVQ